MGKHKLIKFLISRAWEHYTLIGGETCPYSSDSAKLDLVNTIIAEYLIEQAEELDCGSVGGFGRDFEGARSLKNRLDYLLRKYSPARGEDLIEWEN